jgi:tetratricopeptide (TPR) repeat protein
LLTAKDSALTPQPIYAESLEAAWRLGAAPVYAITLDGYRLIRGATETFARVDASAPMDPAETARAERLRGLLNDLLQVRSQQAPSVVAPADARALASLGYLPGVHSLPAAAPDAAVDAELLLQQHRRAARLVATRDVPGAIAALRDLARMHPELAPLHVQLAGLLSASGRTAEAIIELNTAAMLRPDDPDVAIALADAYLRNRQVEPAREHAADAVARLEKSTVPQLAADAHEVSALAALAADDDDAASEQAELADKADAGRPVKDYVRGRIAYRHGDYEEALAALESAARKGDDTYAMRDLQLALGETLVKLDRTKDAEVAFKREIQTFPNNIAAYVGLAQLYRTTNQEDAVEDTVSSLLAAVPTQEAYAAAARLWASVGERAKADALRADARRKFRGAPLPVN